MKHIFVKLLVLVEFIVNTHNSNAQQTGFCGTMQAIEQMKTKDPLIEKRMAEMDKTIAEYVQTNTSKLNTRQQSEVLIVIPVVVHVVYKNSSENVSESNINALINRLNKDFRRKNSDSSSTRGVFKPFAVDAKVEFCLANRDPNGNSTNGITRTSTTVQEFNTTNEIKFTASGGKDAWPRNQYLNLWVGGLVSGLGGYAQFPGEAAATDGVVIASYTANGTERTATHEIGHWLGLYHTFQDGCSGVSDSDCLTGGDRICDTPQQTSSSFGCSFSENTCTEDPTDYPDMLENYMSYNSCQNMFSKDQAERMEAVVNTYRMALKSSFGCCSPAATSITDLPNFEGVEDSIFPSTNWQVLNPDVNVTWSRTDAVSASNTSKASAKMYFFSPAEDIRGQSDYWISPKYNFTAYTSLTLKFNVAYARFTEQSHDSLIIHVTNDQCNGIWTRIWAKGNAELTTAPDHSNEFVPDPSEWKDVSISLDSYAGDTALHIIFEAKSGWGNNLYIDDIKIDPFPLVLSDYSNNSGSIKLYPNPTKGEIHLSINNFSKNDALIKVYNVLGELMLSKNVTFNLSQQNTTLNLSGFQKGLYFLHIGNAEDKFFSEKIILIEKP